MKYPYSGPFVAKRSFKVAGKLVLAGDILEGEDLNVMKHGRLLVNDRKVVPLPEGGKALSYLVEYIKTRWGNDLQANIEARASKGSDIADTGASITDPPPGTEVPPVLEASGIVSEEQLATLGKDTPEVVVPLSNPQGEIVRPLSGTTAPAVKTPPVVTKPLPDKK